jgi:hypothetical protein
MEQTRDAWLAALRIKGPPVVDRLPDLVQGDSLTAQTGVSTSTIERQRFPPGLTGRSSGTTRPRGWATGGRTRCRAGRASGHASGKTNQDVDFADEAWEFFRRHRLSR